MLDHVSHADVDGDAQRDERDQRGDANQPDAEGELG